MEHDVLGKVIKKFRINNGISQEQFAEMLDCSTRHIMSIENENKKPSYKRLYQIIRTLNIPADMIFYPERDKTKETDAPIDELMNMLHMCDERTIRAVTAAVREVLKSNQALQNT